MHPVFPGPTPNLALQLRGTCCILSICGLLQSVATAVAVAEAVNYHSQTETPVVSQTTPHHAELYANVMVAVKDEHILLRMPG